MDFTNIQMPSAYQLHQGILLFSKMLELLSAFLFSVLSNPFVVCWGQGLSEMRVIDKYLSSVLRIQQAFNKASLSLQQIIIISGNKSYNFWQL